MKANRSSRSSLAVSVLAGATILLSACFQTSAMPPSESTVDTPSATEISNPPASPPPPAIVPAIPAWTDLAGRWCSVELRDCFTIEIDTEGNVVNERDGWYSFDEMDGGCFRGLVGPKPGTDGGAANVLFCPPGAESPSQYADGSCATVDDPNFSRLWEFQACGGMHYRAPLDDLGTPVTPPRDSGEIIDLAALDRNEYTAKNAAACTTLLGTPREVSEALGLPAAHLADEEAKMADAERAGRP